MIKIQQEKKTIQDWISKELNNQDSFFYKASFKDMETAKKVVFEYAKLTADHIANASITFDYDYKSYNYNFIKRLNIDVNHGADFSLWGLIIGILFNYWLDHPPVVEKKAFNPSNTQTGSSDFRWKELWDLIRGGKLVYKVNR